MADEPKTGVKYDGEKDRYDLLDDGAINAVVKVLTLGAKKYAPENWRKVPEWRTRYYAAMQRHLASWRQGERLDPETNLPHLAHALCCGIFLLALDTEKTP